MILDGRGCVIPNVLSQERCVEFIADAEARGMDEAPITTAHGFVRRPDIRNNDRAMYDDVAAASSLWTELHPHLPASFVDRGEQGLRWKAIGLNERLRVYRYRPGQAFRWHYDGAFRRNADEVSMFTVLLYLNEVESGGSTVFQPWTKDIVHPETGLALLFEHHVLHQGNEVVEGVKYVLRSDIMFRRLA